MLCLERSSKICDEVIDVLDADGEAEHVRVYSGRYLLLRTELRVGSRCRVHDERLGITYAADMEDELQTCHEGCRRIETSLDAECEYTTESMTEILASEFMVRIALESRIVDAFDSRMILEEFSNSECIVAAALGPQ